MSDFHQLRADHEGIDRREAKARNFYTLFGTGSEGIARHMARLGNCRHVRPRASCMNPDCRARAAVARLERTLDALTGELELKLDTVFTTHDIFRCTCPPCVERREEAQSDATADPTL
jgi:hypothetical protein